MDASVLFFIFWALLCGLRGWITERKGRNGARWIGLALAASILLWSVGEYRAEQEMFFAYTNQGEVVGRNPAATPSPWLPILGAFLILLGAAALPYRNRKRCPDCGETIQTSAQLCRYCRHAFAQAALPNPLERT